MDKFDGTFKPRVVQHTWGHGESGYELTVFSSYTKEEADKAKEFLCRVLQHSGAYFTKDKNG